jgi:hypothetical protein
VNEKSKHTLGELDLEIRRQFGLGASELLGRSIHRMHQNPAHVEQVLRGLRAGPHRGIINFGTVQLDAVWELITDDHDQPLGYMASWESVGERNRHAKTLTEQLDDSTESLARLTNRLAAAAEEFSASISEISANAAQAAVIAADGVRQAYEASSVVATLGSASSETAERSG